MLTTTPPYNGRGCGDRSEKAPYACCGFSENGTPIEFFVVDPAIPWPGKFQRGVKILPRNPRDIDSVNDLVVFVGKKFYESPWSFVEECRRYGASRKLPQNLPFNKLTPGESRMVFVHSKAIPEFDYEADRDIPYYGCSCFSQIMTPQQKEAWNATTPGYHFDQKSCTHALRDLAFLVHSDISMLSDDYGEDTFYQVNMPSFSYESKYPVNPTEVYPQYKWQTGIFMALPLTHIEYCHKADGRSKANAEAAGFETVVMDH